MRTKNYKIRLRDYEKKVFTFENYLTLKTLPLDFAGFYSEFSKKSYTLPTSFFLSVIA